MGGGDIKGSHSIWGQSSTGGDQKIQSEFFEFQLWLLSMVRALITAELAIRFSYSYQSCSIHSNDMAKRSGPLRDFMRKVDCARAAER